MAVTCNCINILFMFLITISLQSLGLVLGWSLFRSMWGSLILYLIFTMISFLILPGLFGVITW